MMDVNIWLAIIVQRLVENQQINKNVKFVEYNSAFGKLMIDWIIKIHFNNEILNTLFLNITLQH